jgi:hypothetical protein
LVGNCLDPVFLNAGRPYVGVQRDWNSRAIKLPFYICSLV